MRKPGQLTKASSAKQLLKTLTDSPALPGFVRNLKAPVLKLQARSGTRHVEHLTEANTRAEWLDYGPFAQWCVTIEEREEGLLVGDVFGLDQRKSVLRQDMDHFRGIGPFCNDRVGQGVCILGETLARDRLPAFRDIDAVPACKGKRPALVEYEVELWFARCQNMAPLNVLRKR